MNKKFKFLTVLLALVMTIGVFAPFSARAAEATETKTVTLHKLLMTKAELDAWDSDKVEENGYDATQDLEGLNGILKKINEKAEKVEEIPNVYFALKFGEGHKGYLETPEVKDGEGKVTKPAVKYTDGETLDGTKTTPDKAPETIEAGKYYVKAKGTEGEDKLTPMTVTYKTKDSKENEVTETYLVATDNVDEAVGGLTIAGGLVFNTSKLKGNFIIDEESEKSTYQGDKGAKLTGSKAVPVEITLPLVNNDGIVENAHVYPKNIEDRPKIDKNFAKENGLTTVIDPETNKDVGADYANYEKQKAKATAEVGKEVKYEVKTFLPENAKYKTVIWKDSMTDGLTYNYNLDISGLKDAEGNPFAKGTDYTLEEDDRGFTLTFTDKGIEKLETALKKGSQDVYLKYSATVNSNSVVDESEKNHVTFEYKHTKTEPTPEPPETTPFNKEIPVVKSWSEGQAPKGVVVVYTLQEKVDEKTWKNVKSVTITEPDYNYTFTGLDDAKTYRVKERVSGYTPEYEIKEGKYNVTNKTNEGPKPLEPTTPEVVNGGKKFVKTNQDKTERLAGAEFYVKNEKDEYLVAKADDQEKAAAKKTAKEALDNAIAEYNKMTKEQQDGEEGKSKKAEIKALQDEYNKAYIEADEKYTWGTKDDPNVVILTSNAAGQFEITGLAYGTYYLEEKTAPAGYAKLNGTIKFEVKENSYKSFDVDINYEQDQTQVKDAKCVANKKVSIPQTGGIGTVIFTVVGVMLMVGAAFALKRRKEDELEGLA